MKRVKAIVLILVLATALVVLARPKMSQALFEKHERSALQRGWHRVEMVVDGRTRQVLWKGPQGAWKGAIVCLHGGGGTYSNFASNISLGQPMVEFGELALQRGFAVFSPDSGWDLAKDKKGRGYGKRWDSFAQSSRSNVDLPFLEKLVDELIPDCRPVESGRGIFLTGISNGGFMTILTASHFPGKFVAFAPVSAGDPYGTTLDLGAKTKWPRPSAPGVFRDRGTKEKISVNQGTVDVYSEEAAWPKVTGVPLPSFKQFHHAGDVGVSLSCMRRATHHLTEQGFKDDGAFILPAQGKRNLRKHFWMSQYNKPLLDYFESKI